MSAVFEGSEKKLEIILKPGLMSLRQYPMAFWESLVDASQAKILSKISSSDCDAYLLSESSLFVWENRLTMITCGTTTLVDAALFAIEKFQLQALACLIYERKNEYFPQKQKTDFFDDVRSLRQKIDGQAFRLGQADEHHLFLFSSTLPYKPDHDDRTLEILMYDLQGAAKDIFNTSHLTAQDIRKKTQIDKILADYQIDDYAFDPVGYSLNALKGIYYYTIHVTPQEVSPYVSFETNEVDKGQSHKILQSVLEIFQPRSFDVVVFDSHDRHDDFNVPTYLKRSQIVHSTENGYTLSYFHYSQLDLKIQKAFELKI